MLTDDAVALRPFLAADAEPLYAAVRESLAEVAPWMPRLHAGLTLDDVRAFIEGDRAERAAGRAYSFAITDASGDEILGGCGLTQVNAMHRFANMYYWVRSSRTGRGVAPAAIRLLARFGFEQLGLQRVEIVVAVGNQASMRAAEKAGALREGLLRSRLSQHGQQRDAVMFALVPQDLVDER